MRFQWGVADTGRHGHRHGDVYRDGNTYVDRHTHVFPNAPADNDGNGKPDADADRDTNSHGDSQLDINRFPDIDFNQLADSDPDANGNAGAAGV